MSEIAEFFETKERPKDVKSMGELIKNYIDSEKVNKEKINRMLSSTIYFEWLSKFMQDKDSFSDVDWVYFPEQLEETDRENVGQLNLFFEGISEYASQNHIYPISSDSGTYYKIKLNGTGFEIGWLAGQGVVHFARKVLIEKETEFIDFADIMAKKVQENVDRINASLISLSNTVLNIYGSGVPIEAIINAFDNTIKEIMAKSDKKSDKLVREQNGTSNLN